MDQPLTARLNARVTRTELGDIRENADAAGLSLSDFIRKCVCGRVIAPARSATDEAMLRELRRVGALVKHSAQGADRVEVNRALAALLAAAERIGR